ncbi:Cation_ATPase_N domain-containing protein [Gammaproteobacteria bacterium]
MNADIKNISGLSSQEVAARLKTHGFNELPAAKQTVLLDFVFKLLREPMFLLLLIGATLYFILGSKTESLMLLSFVVVIIGITCHQERKSDKAIIALRNLSSPRVFVIREGRGMRIAGREVVQGDIIVLNEGDSISADAKLLSATNLLVDEAILTGESHPVRKMVVENPTNFCRPGGDDLPFVYSGTQVVQGSGYARVVATGINTQMGMIGKSLTATVIERTDLQRETDGLVRNFAIFGLVICILVAIIYGVTRTDWLHGFLVGITLAMAILPEEFPVVLIIFLALGAWRISLKNVLTRRIPAVEALGSATVLCVDKTGTLTQNRMTVCQLFAHAQYFFMPSMAVSCALPEIFHQLLEYSILASQRNPFDPMEIAIKNFGVHCLKDTEHLHELWTLVHQYPLSKELLAISQVWQSAKNKDYVIAAKGAPEAIFDLCHLESKQIKNLLEQIELMARKGLRIIGVAKANFADKKLPDIQHDFNFEFLGLIGLEDPIRPNVLESVRSCYQAGIRVVMLTGDYFGTAQHVAEQIGLQNPDAVIVGSELTRMSDLELAQKIKTTNIFARILPEQKLRIVNVLKANGEIVTMTGDGVNDAPALQAANIGVAMGEHGTDVARAAAALVLLDDDFSSLVAAIRLGRRVYANIKKAITYLLAVHIPIIGMTLIPVLFKWPLMLYPIHMVFLELIIDPTCSIVFEAEAEEANVMRRSPRNSGEKLFNRKTVVASLWQGGGVLTLSLAVFMFVRFLGYKENNVRAITFAVLVISNLALIFINCSRQSRNRALWLISAAAIVFLIAVLFIPCLRTLFYF